MSRIRCPSTIPTRVFPAASNVASLNGVSGFVEITGRWARAGATTVSTATSHTTRRITPPDNDARLKPRAPAESDARLKPRAPAESDARLKPRAPAEPDARLKPRAPVEGAR